MDVGFSDLVLETIKIKLILEITLENLKQKIKYFFQQPFFFHLLRLIEKKSYKL